MTSIRLVTFATVATVVMTVAVASAKPAAVVTYPLPAVYSASKVFSLRANGKDVPVVHFSDQYDYAVFEMSDGPCKFEISRVDGKTIKHHAISPMKLKLRGVITTGLSFTLEKPAYLIVAIDDLRRLVIAIDKPDADKPPSSGPGIFNVTAAPYNADGTGAAMATGAIQKALDDATNDSNKKAIVYVPDGVYRVTELRLPSNVSMYLSGGAVIRIAGSRDELKIRYRKKSQNREGTWLLYTADGATNVKVFGRGTIDGDGHRMEHELNLSNHLLVPLNCTNFTLDGPVLRESGLWGVVIANSKQVALRNTKHFNRLDMGEDDCVDVCNSQDVTIDHSIGISLDDPYSTKTWGEKVDLIKQWSGEELPNRDIVISDCLAWTRCFAFKIGAGVWHDQENIIVRNCVVYDSAHAIGVSHSYGSADVKNVLFDTIDVERNTMTNLGRSWARFVIDERKPDGGQGGGVYDVRVRNINVRDAGTDAIAVKGLSDDKPIAGVTFERIYMPGRTAPASKLAEIGVKETSFADRIIIDNRVTTQKQVEGKQVEGRRMGANPFVRAGKS